MHSPHTSSPDPQDRVLGSPAAQEGLCRLEAQDWEGAAAFFAQAWREAPQDVALARMALDSGLLVAGQERQALELALEQARHGALQPEAVQRLCHLMAVAEDGHSLLAELWTELPLRQPGQEGWWEGAVAFWAACGDYDEATRVSIRWLEHAPECPSAAEQLSRLLCAIGHHETAVELLLALVRRSGPAALLEPLSHLVRALSRVPGRQTVAGTLCNILVQEYANDPRPLVLRAELMAQLFEPAHAEADLLQALELAPGHDSAICNLAIAWSQQGRAEDGLRLIEDHSRTQGHGLSAEAINARAILLRRLGRLGEAEAQIRQGLEQAFSPVLATNLAHVLLVQGRYREGFAWFAQRARTGWQQDRWHRAVAQGAQPWDGQVAALRGRSLLVLSQNGIGDTIQFARHVPWLIAQGAVVVLQAPTRTSELLQSLHPELRLVAEDDPLPRTDWVADVMSLPGLLGLTLESVGDFGAACCLKIDATRLQRNRIALGPRRGLRVALAWRGTRSNLARRDIDLSAFAALELPGIEWLSLQYGPLEPHELEPARRMNLRHESWSFADAAAVMVLADIVVSVDTVHAHLAGSLGCSTLVPLSAVPDWRWGLAADSTPWYPTMTLLRQRQADDWSAALQAVQSALLQRAAMAPGAEPIHTLEDALAWMGRAQGEGATAACEMWFEHALRAGAHDAAEKAAAHWLGLQPNSIPAAVALVRNAATSQQAFRLLAVADILADHTQRQPGAAVALRGCARELQRMGLREPALQAAGVALQADPNEPAHWAALAHILIEQHDAPAARVAVERALALAPAHVDARLAQAALHCLESEFGLALQQVDGILSNWPPSASEMARAAAQGLRGLALDGLGRHDEAELAAREVYLQRPDGAQAIALGTQVLARGDWAEGWRLWRMRDRMAEHAPHTHAAVRAGARLWAEPGIQPLRGRRLLVTSENGHGDTFQFGRFLPWLQQQGVHVTLLARPAAFELLSRRAPVGIEVRCEPTGGEALEAYDWVCDAQWLPALLDLQAQALQAHGAADWLSGGGCPVEARAVTEPPTAGLRVGLAWRGQAVGLIRRSMPLQAMAELEWPGVHWISLQPEALSEEESQAAQRLQMEHTRPSFEAAARMMESLDLVVSVDTSIAHLAGALGRPSVVLLPRTADWRWGRTGQSTPWYPKARLLRQTDAGDWGGPLQQLRDALKALQLHHTVMSGGFE